MAEDPFYYQGKLHDQPQNLSRHCLNSTKSLSRFSLFSSGLMEPRFGLGMIPRSLQSDSVVPRAGLHHLPTGYRRPWSLARQAAHELAKDQKNLHFGKDGFQACVDVHHFQPSEVSVKTVDNTVVIEGKHEERDDVHGSIERHFVRKYVLPKDYDMNSIHSLLSSDGILTIKAPPPAAVQAGERHVPIAHTNMPVHLSVKVNGTPEKSPAQAAPSPSASK
jgi:crystallin, alpha B